MNGIVGFVTLAAGLLDSLVGNASYYSCIQSNPIQTSVSLNR
ncbi:unnamed protein product [Tuber melanosporum]|uniref:(Perigord truffle) hypothetical protein n=1 Tax=Tuber melanosporum (strain Mel28) TaxID=656061 RepID=D5GPP8_TUBMM|nr:uncharacterized protein GSTUM_00011964001 [Tuber melanosporum]CAZ86491.1 unnamed protein product [Tuber melanosporum]